MAKKKGGKSEKFDGKLPSDWSAPLKRIEVTSRPGDPRGYHRGPDKTHHGLDLSAKVGTPVYAMGGGTVIKSYLSFPGDKVPGGTTVIIDHGNGLRSMYCHLSGRDVKEGEKVKSGQLIGESGDTGGRRAYEPTATPMAPHLHVGIFIDDGSGWHFTDPTPFVINPNDSDHPGDQIANLTHPHDGSDATSPQGTGTTGGTDASTPQPTDGGAGASTVDQHPDGGVGTPPSDPGGGQPLDGGTDWSAVVPHEGGAPPPGTGISTVPHDGSVDQGNNTDALDPGGPGSNSDLLHPGEGQPGESPADPTILLHPDGTQSTHPENAGGNTDALHPDSSHLAQPGNTDQTLHHDEAAVEHSEVEAPPVGE